ncbi:MAG TPA: hypothetical protein ENG87_05900 [Candidatus Pacearchaeota archaeon]|nr:hypothetical protein [Candidatus Pacearchaeota archaeon]
MIMLKLKFIIFFIVLLFLYVNSYAIDSILLAKANDYSVTIPLLLAGRNTTGSNISTVNLTTFTQSVSLTTTLNANLGAGSIDTTNNVGYFCSNGSSKPIQISKIDLENLIEIDKMELSGSFYACKNMLIDIDKQLLFVLSTSGTMGIIKIDLDSFEKTGQTTTSIGVGVGFVFNPDKTIIYWGVTTFGPTINIRRTYTLNMSSAGSDITVGTGVAGSAISDGTYIYFSTDSSSYGFKIFKIDMSTFSLISTYSSSCMSESNSAVVDPYNTYGYFYSGAGNNGLLKVDFSNFNGGESCLNLTVGLGTSLVYNNSKNDKIYIGSGNVPCKIDKIDVNSFTEDSSITLTGSNNTACTSMSLY